MKSKTECNITECHLIKKLFSNSIAAILGQIAVVIVIFAIYKNFGKLNYVTVSVLALLPVTFVHRFFLLKKFKNVEYDTSFCHYAPKFKKQYFISVFITSCLFAVLYLFSSDLPNDIQSFLLAVFIALTIGSASSIGVFTDGFLIYVLPFNLSIAYLHLPVKNQFDIYVLFLIFSVFLFGFKTAKIYRKNYLDLIELNIKNNQHIKDIERYSHNLDRYLSSIDKLGIGIRVSDASGKTIFCNDSYTKYFKPFLTNYMQSRTLFSDDIVREKIFAGDFVFEVSRNSLEDENKKILYLELYKDITDVEKEKKSLEFKAYHDVLTNLPNREAFFMALQKEIARAKRKFFKFGLFFIDLDMFKEINDNFGHEVGDVVLKTVAKRLKTITRENDFVARYAGDEFIMIVDDMDDYDKIDKVAKKLLDEVSKPIFFDNMHSISPSVSIGVSIFPDDSDNHLELIKKADEAMYVVKNRGRGDFYINSKNRDDDAKSV